MQGFPSEFQIRHFQSPELRHCPGLMPFLLLWKPDRQSNKKQSHWRRHLSINLVWTQSSVEIAHWMFFLKIMSVKNVSGHWLNTQTKTKTQALSLQHRQSDKGCSIYRACKTPHVCSFCCLDKAEQRMLTAVVFPKLIKLSHYYSALKLCILSFVCRMCVKHTWHL